MAIEVCVGFACPPWIWHIEVVSALWLRFVNALCAASASDLLTCTAWVAIVMLVLLMGWPGCCVGLTYHEGPSNAISHVLAW